MKTNLLFDAVPKDDSDVEADNPVADDKPIDTPHDDQGHPLIVPESIWRKTLVDFKRRMVGKRALGRMYCRESVALVEDSGRIVAVGKLLDISEKGCGFYGSSNELKVNDIFFLEFLKSSPMLLARVKVVLRRVTMKGSTASIGIEFIGESLAFQNQLNDFLIEKRKMMGGFGDSESI